MPFGADNLAIPFYMRAMASPLLTGGGFQQAGREMQQGGAMPMMTPEQAMQMMQSPEMRQVLSQFGLHPIESGQLKQSPFFSQGFMQHHPKLGGALSGAMANIAMTPEAPLVSGAGSGMSRAMQGLAGGPEMLRRYQVGQIVAPEQQMAMMMPAYGAQVYKHMVDIWQGEQDRAAKLGADRLDIERIKANTAASRAEQQHYEKLDAFAVKYGQGMVGQVKAAIDAKIGLQAYSMLPPEQRTKVFDDTARALGMSAPSVLASEERGTTQEKVAGIRKAATLGAAGIRAGATKEAAKTRAGAASEAAKTKAAASTEAARVKAGYPPSVIAPGELPKKPEPPRPANVPEDYTFNPNGPKGAGWYKPKPKSNNASPD